MIIKIKNFYECKCCNYKEIKSALGLQLFGKVFQIPFTEKKIRRGNENEMQVLFKSR